MLIKVIPAGGRVRSYLGDKYAGYFVPICVLLVLRTRLNVISVPIYVLIVVLISVPIYVLIVVLIVVPIALRDDSCDRTEVEDSRHLTSSFCGPYSPFTIFTSYSFGFRKARMLKLGRRPEEFEHLDFISWVKGFEPSFIV